ncbi:hypothetical protein [Enterobacter cloacae complex sp. 288G10]|uniref:hypothetical protein n=1 Tax=Enterobacter cloacae complex sp. 288G10 TaxID=3395859 RepID=UPI003CF1CC54
MSGGSILAAHFAAFGDATLTRFEPDFLLVPFKEGRLIREALWPERLYRLTSPWFGRSQILAQRLDELFEGRTFGDVRRRPGAPELMITATDLTTGAPSISPRAIPANLFRPRCNAAVFRGGGLVGSTAGAVARNGAKQRQYLSAASPIFACQRAKFNHASCKAA